MTNQKTTNTGLKREIQSLLKKMERSLRNSRMAKKQRRILASNLMENKTKDLKGKIKHLLPTQPKMAILKWLSRTRQKEL